MLTVSLEHCTDPGVCCTFASSMLLLSLVTALSLVHHVRIVSRRLHHQLSINVSVMNTTAAAAPPHGS